jgi:hypothetical protein
MYVFFLFLLQFNQHPRCSSLLHHPYLPIGLAQTVFYRHPCPVARPFSIPFGRRQTMGSKRRCRGLCEFCLVRHWDLNIASSATFTINFLSSTKISLVSSLAFQRREAGRTLIMTPWSMIGTSLSAAESLRGAPARFKLRGFQEHCNFVSHTQLPWAGHSKIS